MAAYKDEQRGTWYVSFHYYDWTGKNCRKVKRGFKTKREATEWERHFRMKEAADLDMTFEEFVQAYTRDMKPKLKHNTWLTKEHILRTKLLPYFKDNNWNAGMVAGIRAVNGYLDGSMENINNDESEDDPLEFIIIFFVIFGGFIGIGLYANWRKTRCPHCKKHKLQRLSSKVIDRSNGTKTEEVVYKCRNCGHILRRKERSRDENYKGPRGGGPFIGGMGGGFFGGHGGSGGGFSGGSFGGGSFGGGGAGSRF